MRYSVLPYFYYWPYRGIVSADMGSSGFDTSLSSRRRLWGRRRETRICHCRFSRHGIRWSMEDRRRGEERGYDFDLAGLPSHKERPCLSTDSASASPPTGRTTIGSICRGATEPTRPECGVGLGREAWSAASATGASAAAQQAGEGRPSARKRDRREGKERVEDRDDGGDTAARQAFIPGQSSEGPPSPIGLS